MKRLTKKYLKELVDENVGGMSDASKMPWKSWSLNSDDCKLGSALKFVEGTVCSKCYADKGNYNYPNVVAAQDKRLSSLSTSLKARAKWADTFVEYFKGHLELGLPEEQRYFRWLDSGDIQTVEMLEDISYIASRVPEIQFWLPTRGTSIFKQWFLENNPPDNLCIRFSANVIGKPVTHGLAILHKNLSESAVDYTDKDYEECPAPKQGNSCGDCRKCWDPTVKVGYLLH